MTMYSLQLKDKSKLTVDEMTRGQLKVKGEWTIEYSSKGRKRYLEVLYD